MGRILGVDFGLKRTGLSATDPMQIIVQGLDTVETDQLDAFLKKYLAHEEVDAIVVGYPFLDGVWGDTKFRKALDAFIESIKKNFPLIPVKLHDERYTSFTAKEIIRQSGKRKSQREDKALVDKTSAIVILQEYLGHI